MRKGFHLRELLLATGLILVGGPTHAATFITTGQTVGGSTVSLSLNASAVTVEPNASKSNDGSGNLVFTPGLTDTNTDWYVTWVNLTTLNIDTSIYRYVQIDIAATGANLVASNWQTFFQDDDSTIGGATNSGQNIGTAPVNATPYSLVIDMTGATGSQAWGPGTLDLLRFDMYEGNATNKGESITISGMTLGSALVPEPSSALLAGLGGLLLFRRRRA